MKFLIVEDNEINIKVLNLFLTNYDKNAEVVIARNGREAIDLYSESIDLVYLDLGLPDMNGIEVAQMLRKKIKKHIPIIVCTAHSPAQSKQLCLEVGVDDYIEKPITFENIVLTIKRWVLNKI